jgi:hypothetical protein
MAQENQLIDYGTVIGFDEHNPNFAIISDGFFQVKAFVPNQHDVQAFKSYLVYKRGNTYYLGAEVST